MEKKENGKILNFLYNTQNRRRINPLYAIFTPIGLFYVIAGYLWFTERNSGMISLIAYIAIGLYIYNNKMNYRFYHHNRLKYFHMFTEYLAHREKVDSYKSIKSYLEDKNAF